MGAAVALQQFTEIYTLLLIQQSLLRLRAVQINRGD